MRADAVTGRRRTQRGYTLMEMGLVLSLLAMIASYAYPSLQRQLERRAVQNTADGVGTFAQLALQYHALEERWPDDIDALLRHFSLQGNFRNRNGFGRAYALRAAADGHLEVHTRTDTPEQALALHRLTRPLSVVQGTSVTVSIPPSGNEEEHLALLPRDGSRPMLGNIDLNGRALHNLSVLSVAGTASVRIRNTAGTAHLSADSIDADAMFVETLRAGRFLYR